MKHCNDCMGGAPARQGFFADAVIWRGETRGAEVQGRIIPSEILPDPSQSGLTLKRLTVMDECAEQADARIEFDACGNARAVGRLNIPLEAEFTDAGGNTYFGRSMAAYDVSIAARGVEREDCGSVVLRCAARDMTVQAISADSVNYAIRLDAYAYLARYEFIRPEADACPGTVTVREGRMPCATFERRITPDMLAAGAMRVGRQPLPPQDIQPAMPQDDDDDEYRTVVAMPIHKRRRGCRQ